MGRLHRPLRAGAIRFGLGLEVLGARGPLASPFARTGCPAWPEGRRRAQGDLFLRVGETVLWHSPGPELDLSETLPGDHAVAGSFYLSYAVMDLIEALTWQLAEPAAVVVAANPFQPLVRCYAHRLYPFALDRATVVLFGFRR